MGLNEQMSTEPKQMPPSDFFMSLGNDTNIDDDKEDEEDDEPSAKCVFQKFRASPLALIFEKIETSFSSPNKGNVKNKG